MSIFVHFSLPQTHLVFEQTYTVPGLLVYIKSWENVNLVKVRSIMRNSRWRYLCTCVWAGAAEQYKQFGNRQILFVEAFCGS